MTMFVILHEIDGVKLSKPFKSPEELVEYLKEYFKEKEL